MLSPPPDWELLGDTDVTTAHGVTSPRAQFALKIHLLGKGLQGVANKSHSDLRETGLHPCGRTTKDKVF